MMLYRTDGHATSIRAINRLGGRINTVRQRVYEIFLFMPYLVPTVRDMADPHVDKLYRRLWPHEKRDESTIRHRRTDLYQTWVEIAPDYKVRVIVKSGAMPVIIEGDEHELWTFNPVVRERLERLNLVDQNDLHKFRILLLGAVRMIEYQGK